MLLFLLPFMLLLLLPALPVNHTSTANNLLVDRPAGVAGDHEGGSVVVEVAEKGVHVPQNQQLGPALVRVVVHRQRREGDVLHAGVADGGHLVRGGRGSQRKGSYKGSLE